MHIPSAGPRPNFAPSALPNRQNEGGVGMHIPSTGPRPNFAPSALPDRPGTPGGEGSAPASQRPAARPAPISSDPMLAMITAQHFSQKLAMQELSGLAADQKASNEAQAKVRAVEEHLSKMLMGGAVTRSEIDQLKALAEEAGVNIDQAIQQLHDHVDGAMEWRARVHPDAAPLAPDAQYFEYHEHSDEGYHRERRDTVKDIREQLTRRRDDIKGEAANRELDIQRVSQELSTAMQMQSNLSKRWSDTLNQIVSNTR